MVEISVVAFDPGETTGYCVMTLPKIKYLTRAEYNMNIEIEWHIGEIDCKAITSSELASQVVHQHSGLNMAGENVGVTEMLDLVWEASNPVVVLEDFILDVRQANMSRSLLSPVRITAAFGFGMWMQELSASVFIVNRGDPKRICTNERLRGWGFYQEGSGEHARDATRLAYHFLRDCRGGSLKAQENRWRAWPHLFEDPQAQSEIIPIRKRPLGERIPGL
jgi:hypothetical protein